jgi:hypothetical protein
VVSPPPLAELLAVVVVVDDSEVLLVSGALAALVSPEGEGTTVSFVVSLHPTVATPARKTRPINAADLPFGFFMSGIVSTHYAGAACWVRWNSVRGI